MQSSSAALDPTREPRRAVLARSVAIGVIAFLTLIDLFGAQALLPSLVEAYQATPAEMGVAVNASTIGMAIAGVAVAIFSRRIDRRKGVWISLALLSIPTLLLGFTDDLRVFAGLRVVQGVFMSAAFALTLSYLSEVCSVTAARGAMAAYITGNVASNFFGRLLASGVADNVGLSETFFVFAALNLAGAALAYFYFAHWSAGGAPGAGGSTLDAMLAHARDRRLAASFAIGFLILFAFVGVYSYVNFVLAAEPFALPQTMIGLVYVVFLPSMLTTPLAAGAAARLGARPAFCIGMGAALLGAAMLLSASLALVLAGLTLIGAGLFFAQAIATGYVGRTASSDPAAANGLYLTSYYLGGLAGAWALGQVFAGAGWTATVGVVAAAIGAGLVLGTMMTERAQGGWRPSGDLAGE